MDEFKCLVPVNGVLPQCDERIAALHRYWQRIRPMGLLPGRQHFEPLAVHTLLPWIWLVDVAREPKLRFKYRLLGTEQVRAMGCDPTGQWIDEKYPHFPQSPSYEQFIAAAERGSVGYRRGLVAVHVRDDNISTERVLLPLARNGRAVEMLLGLTVYLTTAGSEAGGKLRLPGGRRPDWRR